MIVMNGDAVLADNVRIADSFMMRLMGLMGKRSLETGEGLFLENCSSIHCFFMMIPIDAVYLSKDMTVLSTQTVHPWHIGKWVSGTRHILELGAGEAAAITKGARIRINSEQYERSDDYGRGH
jgi:uncharacterized membrane protein (UPF0127 family)